jgi:hypothetical protein
VERKQFRVPQIHPVKRSTMASQRILPIRQLLPMPVNKLTAATSSATTRPISDTGNIPPQRTEIPERLRRIEPSDPPYFNSNIDPVFEVRYAARILGISQDLLEKWRQRGQGPDYLQYGKNGPVRYELSALKAYMENHRIHPAHRPGIR